MIFVRFKILFPLRTHIHVLIKYTQISLHLRDDDENYVLLWFVLYLLRIWGTVRYGLFVYRMAKGEDNVYQFDHTDMAPMHFQRECMETVPRLSSLVCCSVFKTLLLDNDSSEWCVIEKVIVKWQNTTEYSEEKEQGSFLIYII